MSSLIFGAAIVVFLVVVFWYVRNERAGDKAGTLGLFGLVSEDDDRGEGR